MQAHRVNKLLFLVLYKMQIIAREHVPCFCAIMQWLNDHCCHGNNTKGVVD